MPGVLNLDPGHVGSVKAAICDVRNAMSINGMGLVPAASIIWTVRVEHEFG
jgi:hypothetical protein